MVCDYVFPKKDKAVHIGHHFWVTVPWIIKEIKYFLIKLKEKLHI